MEQVRNVTRNDSVSFTFLQYTKIYLFIDNAFACVLVHYIPFVIVRIHVDTHLKLKPKI